MKSTEFCQVCCYMLHADLDHCGKCGSKKINNGEPVEYWCVFKNEMSTVPLGMFLWESDAKQFAGFGLRIESFKLVVKF